MKIIVTGGAGFIGSHLVRALLKEGHELAVIDELHHYYPPERKKEQLEFAREAGSFVFLKKGLLTDDEEVGLLFKKFRADCVIHLAAIPGVQKSLTAPLEYVDYDIKATVNVLKFSGETNVKHVLFASSSSVYGDLPNSPVKEEMAAGRVVSPYAAAKYGAESFCHAYAALYGFQMTILRFFTVYGPWGRPDMAIPGFIKNLIRNEPITLFGGGTARDYTYIDDCVGGILSAVKSAKGNQVYNLGSAQPISIEKVADTLAGHFPDAKVLRSGRRVGDVNFTWADITKAKRELDYSPRISFEEGIARTVEWAKSYEK
ncbi:UDP-glucose 4-epimerase [Neobacillus piezotolerans]|uniref:UDP-glucose 4-epimerase n=1 Tax=Neobacillus piezotolerans TaxID=2259171 RepID=A0A3D8GQ15_9BACI|nr:NAD-dependent epimerase/dehydratase family protein [Neobacillus piezotolerans]RDU36259.1 UDP-glucose 4-epimerase [Neobacillus piezotolerans]